MKIEVEFSTEEIKTLVSTAARGKVGSAFSRAGVSTRIEIYPGVDRELPRIIAIATVEELPYAGGGEKD